MKKKLFIGFASVAAVGTFWACGDGTINKFDEQDEITQSMYGDEQSLKAMQDNAMHDCMANPDCEAKYHDYLLDPTAYSSAEDQPVSSAAGPTSSMSFPMSSSSINRTTKQSSSSRNIIDPGSSSAETVPVSGLGSCKPTKSPIDKTKSTTWDFTPNLASGTTMQEFIQASYSWNFGDDGTGTGMTSEAITYAGSGPKTASVTVTVGLKSETIACSNLQVNGAPITGCKCVPDATEPDVVSGPVNVTWTVSDCASTGATITGYTWTGATGTGETAVASVSAKGDEVTPVVSVSNDDGTVQDFPCTGVKAIDTSAPDYEILEANGSVTLPKAGTYTIVMGGSNPGGCQIWCKSATGESWSASVNGGTATSGTYHASLEAKASDCSGSMSLALTGATSAVECGANWW